MRKDAIAAYLQEHIVKECGVPGCDIVVAKDHEIIYQNKIGVEDQQLFYLYSTTKPITATAALRLYEEGRLDIDAPVAKYLPAFQHLLRKEGDALVPVKTPLTVRHLFTMTGGFDYDLYTAPTQAVLEEKGENVSTFD
ncbi:MAG: beta-lactamase family protein, partial [Clostridia bacterium]|nr:beta-lactamase family protein [Clostridia bacterium]